MCDPRLLKPLFVMAALANVLAVTGAVVPEVVVVAQRLDVGTGVFGAGVENMALVRELGQDRLLFVGRQDVPGTGKKKDSLARGLAMQPRNPGRITNP